MSGEITAIESQTERKKVLIIDYEVGFCMLMKSYLLRKNFNVSTSYSPRDAMAKVEIEKPEVIIANRNFYPNFEKHLNEKIESIPGYSPSIFFESSNVADREGAVIYTLNKDYCERPKSFLERLTEYIKDIFS
jgi:DNA-binding NtrC family response regulator